MSAKTLSLGVAEENKEYFIAAAADGKQIIVQPETKRARILHRAQSEGADDWEVFTSFNGDQYIASRQKMKPPCWHRSPILMSSGESPTSRYSAGMSHWATWTLTPC